MAHGTLVTVMISKFSIAILAAILACLLQSQWQRRITTAVKQQQLALLKDVFAKPGLLEPCIYPGGNRTQVSDGAINADDPGTTCCTCG
jgi:hypothetical protein